MVQHLREDSRHAVHRVPSDPANREPWRRGGGSEAGRQVLAVDEDPDPVLPRLLKERVRADRPQLVGGRGAAADLHTGSEREEQARSRSHGPLWLRSRVRTWISAAAATRMPGPEGNARTGRF